LLKEEKLLSILEQDFKITFANLGNILILAPKIPSFIFILLVFEVVKAYLPRPVNAENQNKKPCLPDNCRWPL
jgi:hypothetical protein